LFISLSKVESAEDVNCNFLYFCVSKNFHIKLLKKVTEGKAAACVNTGRQPDTDP